MKTVKTTVRVVVVVAAGGWRLTAFCVGVCRSKAEVSRPIGHQDGVFCRGCRRENRTAAAAGGGLRSATIMICFVDFTCAMEGKGQVHAIGVDLNGQELCNQKTSPREQNYSVREHLKIRTSFSFSEPPNPKLARVKSNESRIPRTAKQM